MVIHIYYYNFQVQEIVIVIALVNVLGIIITAIIIIIGLLSIIVTNKLMIISNQNHTDIDIDDVNDDDDRFSHSQY